MNILWVHEVSYKTKPVYEFQDSPERLVALGHNVRVVDFDEQHAVTRQDVRISRTGIADVTLSSIPHSNIPVYKYFQARKNYRRFLKDELKKGTIDAVLLYSVFINGTQTVRMCNNFGVPVIYRILDAYHRLRPGFFTRKLLLFGERYIYRNVNQILAVNEGLVKYVHEIVDKDAQSNIKVINHCVDTEHFCPQTTDAELAARYNITPDSQVAVFLGTTYTFARLDALIENIGLITARLPGFKLLILGSGDLDAKMQKQISENGLGDRIHLTGMLPYGEITRYLSLARLALNPFAINEITRDIIPIKILQYLAAGLPVLSTPLPDLVKQFPDYQNGIRYSESDSMDSFIDTMMKLLPDTQQLRTLGNLGRQVMVEQYSVQQAVLELQAVLQEHIRSRPEQHV